jgi:predicted DNA-binding transcriptional regulator AlpA
MHDTVGHALKHDRRHLQCQGTPMNFTFNPLDHPDAEVTCAYFCQLTSRSRITAYRLERSDPHWPKPVLRGKRVFYKAADCKRYLLSVHAQDFTS